MPTEPTDSQLESSFQLCVCLAVLRVLILIPLFTGALLLTWLAPEPDVANPRSAWTDEFEIRALSDYEPSSSTCPR